MMQLLYSLIIALIAGAIIIFIRYKPMLDLVESGNKYILLLWFNKYDWLGDYERRTYIKLFEV